MRLFLSGFRQSFRHRFVVFRPHAYVDDAGTSCFDGGNRLGQHGLQIARCLNRTEPERALRAGA